MNAVVASSSPAGSSLRSAGERTRLAALLALLTLAVRLVLGQLITGTEDVGLSWQMAGNVAAGESPYVGALAAWPPVWPFLAALAYRAESFLPISAHLAIKLWPIAADVAIALILFSWAAIGSTTRRAFRFALLWALNPISIYITAVHGNFDSLPSLALLLAVLFARWEGRGSLRSAVWLSAGIATKTWPLFALPAFLSLRRFRASVWYAVVAIVPSAAMLFLLWLREPGAIVENVFRYRSIEGWWGTTGLAALLSLQARSLSSVLFYGAMALTAALFLSHRDPSRSVTALLLGFLAFAHGFGGQYLVWPVAVGLLVAPRVTMAYSVVAALTLMAEGLGRPWTGELGQQLVAVPTRLFLDAYGGDRDQAITTLVRLPVWLFALVWWGTMVLERSRELVVALRQRLLTAS